MTDADLLTLIRNTPALKALADAGRDYDLAVAVNAALPKPTPITVASLQAAAPQTLAAIAAAPNPLSEMEVIASRLRANDANGIGQWASSLALLNKMSAAEHTAVNNLVAAATTGDSVDHTQVSRVLNAIRPTVDGAIRALPINWSAV